MNPETWLPVVGYETIYEVSDYGNVRSLERYVGNCHGTQTRRKSLVLKQTPDSKSRYQSVTLWVSGKKSWKAVHVLVALAFLGPRPEGLTVRHINGNSHDNRLSNLVWGTSQENNLDIVRHGRHHNANKTKCPNGHEYPPHVEGKARPCRTCQRDRYHANKHTQE